MSSEAAILEKGKPCPMTESIYFEYNGKTISDIIDEIRNSNDG